MLTTMTNVLGSIVLLFSFINLIVLADEDSRGIYNHHTRHNNMRFKNNHGKKQEKEEEQHHHQQQQQLRSGSQWLASLSTLPQQEGIQTCDSEIRDTFFLDVTHMILETGVLVYISPTSKIPLKNFSPTTASGFPSYGGQFVKNGIFSQIIAYIAFYFPPK